MREQIILAPGVNGNELIKSLAENGRNCFNLKVVNARQLAETSLIKTGVYDRRNVITRNQEYSLTAKALSGIDYFGKCSFTNIVNLTNAIKSMRSFCIENEESYIEEALLKGVFKEKNNALFRIYCNYMKLLSKENEIDNISLVKSAISSCEPHEADFFCLEEYPLNPLEKALLEKVSGGRYACLSICELFGAEEKGIEINKIRNCYGAPNEVETIIDDIYKSNTLDKCVVAVTDTSLYSQLFFDICVLCDIPVTFGCGIPASTSNPAKLLKLYYHWSTDGFFSASYLEKMICDSSFDKGALTAVFKTISPDFSWREFEAVLYPLRLTNDSDKNNERIRNWLSASTDDEKRKYEQLIRKTSEILSLPLSEFIEKYTYIRKGSGDCTKELVMQFDMSAKHSICEKLKILESEEFEQNAADVIPDILSMTVCSQSSREGALHISSIPSAVETIRENLYIAGLNSSVFPGLPKENYLFLDDDISNFAENASEYTSDGLISRKKQQLISLVKLASALKNNIYLSYAGMNVSELKRDNASSVVYELFRCQHGEAATSSELSENIEKVSYFEPSIYSFSETGRKYNMGLKVIPDNFSHREKSDIENTLSASDNYYSPSALSTFFECERKFLLKHILHIKEDEQENLFTVIAPNEEGTLAHKLMEDLSDSSPDLDEFIEKSSAAFDSFILKHPPLIPENAESVKLEFLDMMRYAYESDPKREIVLTEEDVRCIHDCGVGIHGFPDRVEKLENGKRLVVDYKSGRKVKHSEDNFISCLQGYIYSFLMEQKGYEIEGCEFRYIRTGDTVFCKYDEEKKNMLRDTLIFFKNELERGVFPITTEKENCKYCTYKDICEKMKKEGC